MIQSRKSRVVNKYSYYRRCKQIFQCAHMSLKKSIFFLFVVVYRWNKSYVRITKLKRVVRIRLKLSFLHEKIPLKWFFVQVIVAIIRSSFQVDFFLTLYEFFLKNLARQIRIFKTFGNNYLYYTVDYYIFELFW